MVSPITHPDTWRKCVRLFRTERTIVNWRLPNNTDSGAFEYRQYASSERLLERPTHRAPQASYGGFYARAALSAIASSFIELEAGSHCVATVNGGHVESSMCSILVAHAEHLLHGDVRLRLEMLSGPIKRLPRLLYWLAPTASVLRFYR